MFIEGKPSQTYNKALYLHHGLYISNLSVVVPLGCESF